MRAEMQLRVDEKNFRVQKKFVTDGLRFIERNY